jgi:L-asparagine transporter-like permease
MQTYMVGVKQMSASMLKMWISFAGMILLMLAIGLILLSRYKLKGWLAGIVSVLAYLSLIIGGLIIIYIVFSGPTG